MLKYLAVTLVVGLVCCGLVYGQEDRAERTRSRVKSKASCHMKELGTCATEGDEAIKQPGASKMITTAEGIAKLCGLGGNARVCLEAYLKRCGTPIQNELYKFFTEPALKRAQQFCAPGEMQTEFLKHSPCLEEKVLRDPVYRNECVDPFFAATDFLQDKTDVNDKVETMCCAYHQWQRCSMVALETRCGADSINTLNTLVKKGLAGFLVTVCPDAAYPPGAERCVVALPPPGTPAKKEHSENPFQKYGSSYMQLLMNPN